MQGLSSDVVVRLSMIPFFKSDKVLHFKTKLPNCADFLKGGSKTVTKQFNKLDKWHPKV